MAPAPCRSGRSGRASRVSPSSILHHYGQLEQLLRVAAHWTGRARRAAIADRAGEGALAFLPATDDDVVDARVWLAWAEMWRSDPAVEVVLGECRQEERALLARLTDYRYSREGLDTLTALIDGLTTAVSAPRDPMPPARARELLAAWTAGKPSLGGP